MLLVLRVRLGLCYLYLESDLVYVTCTQSQTWYMLLVLRVRLGLCYLYLESDSVYVTCTQFLKVEKDG